MAEPHWCSALLSITSNRRGSCCVTTQMPASSERTIGPVSWFCLPPLFLFSLIYLFFFRKVNQEAVSTGDPEILKLVLTHRDSHMLKNQAKIITSLLDKLKATPDFYVEIKWEFTSWCKLTFLSYFPSFFTSCHTCGASCLEPLGISILSIYPCLTTLRKSKIWNRNLVERRRLVWR